MKSKSHNQFDIIRYFFVICIFVMTILIIWSLRLSKRFSIIPPHSVVETFVIKNGSSKTIKLCPPLTKKFTFEEFKCYQLPKNATQPINLLEDITESKIQPTNGTGIFFFETSCAKDGLINLNSR